MELLLPDITLLIDIANRTGYTYVDAYSVWLECRHQQEAYLIVDTVLWLAKRHKVPIMDAMDLFQGVEDQFR